MGYFFPCSKKIYEKVHFYIEVFSHIYFFLFLPFSFFPFSNYMGENLFQFFPYRKTQKGKPYKKIPTYAISYYFLVFIKLLFFFVVVYFCLFIFI